MKIGEPNCGSCKKRPRGQHGNSRCPHLGTYVYAERAALDSHDCGAFVFGDARSLLLQEARENLADNLELF